MKKSDLEKGLKPMRIYADNAATTKTSKKAIEAMLPYFDKIYGNPSSLHSRGQEAAEALMEARAKIASLIGAEPREIYFTSGGSEADNQAIISAAKTGERIGKKHIISTKFEHHAVLHTLKKLEKDGFEVTLVDVNDDGIVKVSDIEKAIREDTCLVTVMFANNEIGTIQPIAQIGKLCHEKGVVFHTDAVQAVGHIAVDVNELSVDMLSASAHKFHGPKGVGFLYCKKGVILRTLIEGGAQERGKRAGTENIPAVMGMAVALEESLSNLEKTDKTLILKRDKLITELEKIPHSKINGDKTKRLSSNVNICFEGIEGESLLLLLDENGIEASSGSACTSGSLDPSHVLLSIGLPHDVAHGSLRLSISEDTTDQEIDYIIESVKEVVAYLRELSPVWEELTKGKREFIL